MENLNSTYVPSAADLELDNFVQEYIVDDVLPHPEIHVIAGPSGGGKTTILAQLIAQMIGGIVGAEGNLWFGHKVHPTPFAYISGERTAQGVARTMRRVGIKPSACAIISSIDMPNGVTLKQAVDLALKKRPDAKLFFVEGLVRFIPGGKMNDARVVTDFMTNLQRVAIAKGVTFILVTWSPKQKEGERIINPRQRAMGSVAVAGTAETIILIEPGSDDTCTLMLLMKNSKDEIYYLRKDDKGVFHPIDSPKQGQGKIEDYVLGFSHDFRFSTEDIIDSFPEVSRPTIMRTLKQLVLDREVSRICKGRYRRVKTGGDLPDLPPGIPPESPTPAHSL